MMSLKVIGKQKYFQLYKTFKRFIFAIMRIDLSEQKLVGK